MLPKGAWLLASRFKESSFLGQGFDFVCLLSNYVKTTRSISMQFSLLYSPLSEAKYCTLVFSQRV